MESRLAFFGHQRSSFLCCWLLGKKKLRATILLYCIVVGGVIETALVVVCGAAAAAECTQHNSALVPYSACAVSPPPCGETRKVTARHGTPTPSRVGLSASPDPYLSAEAAGRGRAAASPLSHFADDRLRSSAHAARLWWRPDWNPLALDAEVIPILWGEKERGGGRMPQTHVVSARTMKAQHCTQHRHASCYHACVQLALLVQQRCLTCLTRVPALPTPLMLLWPRLLAVCGS